MQTYQLTDDEYNELLEASKPTPYIVIGGREPEGPYEKVMRIWKRISVRVGCDWQTVGPGPTEKEFCAQPLEPAPSPVREASV